jgi:alpha-mannosidase
MKKTTFIFLLILLFFNGTTQEDNSPLVSFPQPYEYKESENGFVVKAIISPVKDKDFKALFLEETKLDYTVNESGLLETFLPLVGEPMKLNFKDKKDNKVLASYSFEPLIPADWGFFNNGKVHIICSSHQDIAWMNTPDSCKHERVFDIVLPALDLMEKNPEFKFEMEQSLNLMEVLEEAPKSRQRIIDAYQSGNFTWGATLTQPYEGLESGEQLVRQNYFGRKWIKDNLPGMDAQVAYNIDVPGRSLQVPQILNKAGIDYLFVSRMKEGFYNWYSPDGSRILTYSPGNYGWSLLVYKYLEEDAVTAMHKLSKVMKNRNEYYREHNLPPHYAIVISTDAGGPKYYKEVIDGWNKIASKSGQKIPLIQHSTAEDFLGEMDVPEARFDSIYGERPNLWLYIHGAAHYEAIKAKKAAAVSIPSAEMFSTINCLLEDDFSAYPKEKLNLAWYKSIYPDHGWGGKNGAITDSIFGAYLKEGNQVGTELLKESIDNISAKIEFKNNDNVIVFNDLPWKRSGQAIQDISDRKGDNWMVSDESGNTVPSQILHSANNKQLIFEVQDIPSIGYKTYLLKNAKPDLQKEEPGINFYENKYYKINFGKGGITSLFDKELNRQIINSTRFAAGDLLHLGYNGHGAGEFIQITEPNVQGYEKLHEKAAKWERLENGEVFSSFQATYQMTGFTVSQKITLFHHKKQIDFEYDIPDWDGTHNRQLRIAFPLNMKKQAQISYDVPMGMVHVGKDELKSSPGGWSWDGTYQQKPEYIHPREIQNYMTASNSDFGVSMSTNIVTADWIDPSREAVDYPVLQAILLSTHKSCHGLGNWYEQKGSHHFKISLNSHKAGWKNGFHFGTEGNHPFLTSQIKKKQNGLLPSQYCFVQFNSNFINLTALKKAENSNDVIIRVVETEGKNKILDAKIHWDLQKLYHTNLIEEEEQLLPANGNSFKTEIEKNAIETFKLEF